MPPDQAVPDAGAPGNRPALPSLSWKQIPAGWEEVTPGEMRLASFRVKGSDGKQADMGIFPLPGMAGNDLDNVNRWRTQVGQPAITEAELAKLALPVEIAGQAAQVYEQAGTNPSSGDKTRILAAILRREGVAWFFKLNGDDDLVAQQKTAFVDFLKGLTFTAAPATELPPSHPPIEGMTMPAGQPMAANQAPAAARPQWEVPGNWKETDAGQFLVAKFLVSGADNAQAAVNVSMSAGDGGGLAGNVNRWRKQLGLPELPEPELSKMVSTVDTPAGKIMAVDMTGTDARTGEKARLIGAIVPQSGRAWFYKLMGSEQLVEREKDAFNRFVQTARYSPESSQ